jgi:two-component system, OmpR family, response regulator
MEDGDKTGPPPTRGANATQAAQQPQVHDDVRHTRSEAIARVLQHRGTNIARVTEAISPLVLLIEDDESLAAALLERLVEHGFSTHHERDGRGGIRAWQQRSPAVVLLDLALPKASGRAVLSGRPSLPPALVIVLTASADVSTRVQMLEAGADDYLAKPFFTEELVARIRRRLARQPEPSAASRLIAFADVLISLDARTCSVAGIPVHLTPTEWAVLVQLAERPGHTISRAALMEVALQDDGSRFDRTVDSHVSRLRSKLGAAKVHIESVWGIGWRLVP